MRKQLFLLLLSLGIYSLCAQNYFPMPESDVIWGQDHYSANCFNPLNLCSEFQYTFGGDTIIAGESYKILNRSGYRYDDFLVRTYFFEYAGGFRQEVENKRVYFLERNREAEELLYDFNLSVGDTLPPAYNNRDGIVIVTSIDSVLVGEQYRKRFKLLHYGEQFEMIEGIGSNTGLLEPFAFFEDGYNLRCFNLNDSIYYPEYGDLCDFITGNHELAVESLSLTVRPNPVSGISVIEITGTNENPLFLEIVNLEGQTCKKIPVVKNTSVTISKSDLAPGLYFCVLKSEENRVSRTTKFVVK